MVAVLWNHKEGSSDLPRVSLTRTFFAISLDCYSLRTRLSRTKKLLPWVENKCLGKMKSTQGLLSSLVEIGTQADHSCEEAFEGVRSQHDL